MFNFKKAWVLGLMLFAGGVWADELPNDDYDDGAPDLDYVWVDGQQLRDGRTLDGFYRVRTRDGFRWVAAHYREDGVWIDAHWSPLTHRPGQVWVRGHVGDDGYWVAGHWRHEHRDGYRWVAGSHVDGVYRHGHWQPLKDRHDHAWVPGYWAPAGVWVSGFWRPTLRVGFAWNPGHWRYGRWVHGHWKPRSKPGPAHSGHVWVAGHYGSKGWVAGFWRPKARVGFHWSPGHLSAGGVWIVGGWRKGPRPAATRTYRVRHVNTMRHTRRGKHKLWHAGDRQQELGRAQEKAGRKMQRQGERSGNQRRAERGERLQERGKKNKRKGKKKKERSWH